MEELKDKEKKQELEEKRESFRSNGYTITHLHVYVDFSRSENNPLDTLLSRMFPPFIRDMIEKDHKGLAP